MPLANLKEPLELAKGLRAFQDCFFGRGFLESFINIPSGSPFIENLFPFLEVHEVAADFADVAAEREFCDG